MSADWTCLKLMISCCYLIKFSFLTLLPERYLYDFKIMEIMPKNFQEWCFCLNQSIIFFLILNVCYRICFRMKHSTTSIYFSQTLALKIKFWKFPLFLKIAYIFWNIRYIWHSYGNFLYFFQFISIPIKHSDS